jgi:hypothetical protein
MRIIPILAIVLALTAGGMRLAAADIPDGSTATVQAMPGTGMLRIGGPDNRAYFLPIHQIIGVQSKPNGCTVTMHTEQGDQAHDYLIPADALVAMIRASR